MFSMTWKSEDNIPILTNDLNSSDQIQPPRPVYSDELDLLGFKAYWEYPQSDDPLLWAIGRSYYYGGVEVAKACGGSIAEDPRLSIFHAGKLKPIDIGKLIEANRSKLTILENEAKMFVNKVYKNRRGTDQFAVAYSGGKDSQSILELVAQVIPPEAYFIIYTNTGMELPDNIQSVRESIASYQRRFPKLQFSMAEQLRDIYDNWKDFGPPSRLQRWCCSVTKSIPFYVALSSLSEERTTTVFEGVRREESFARSSYERQAGSVKHTLVTNVRPIIDWSDTEVYLYLMFKGVKINPLYKLGLSRVGCSLCPFSSDWSEFLIRKIYPNLNDRFLDEIYETFHYNGLHIKEKQAQYITTGKWKTRGGEKYLNDSICSIDLIKPSNPTTIKISNPRSDLLSWIRVFKHHISNDKNGSYILNIQEGKDIGEYHVTETNDSLMVTIAETNPAYIDSDFMKILVKAAYCVGCHACYVECPNKAISFTPSIQIDMKACTHCLNCIKSIPKGCLVASSRSITIGEKNMKDIKLNIDRYSTFGLRESWLLSFLNSPDHWESGLGSKQVKALKKWLSECELITDKRNISDLVVAVKGLALEETWGVVWTNLCYNSAIVEWYHKQDFRYWRRQDLFDKLKMENNQYSEGTLNNPMSALINTLDNSSTLSDLLGQGVLEKKGRNAIALDRKGVSHLSPNVLVYCLFKLAEKTNTYNMTLSELYQNGTSYTPYRLFGLKKEALSKLLVSLQEHKSRLVRVEFNANLDNIFLNKDFSALEALRTYLGKS